MLSDRSHSLVSKVGMAVAAVALCTALRWVLQPSLHDHAPFLVFTLAVAFASWYGGLWTGLLTVAFSVLAGSLLFVAPVGFLLPRTVPDALNLALFVTIGIITALLGEAMHAASRRAAQMAADAEQNLAAARRSERRLADILGSAMDAIITVDADQRIVLFNAAAEKVFGASAEEVLGDSLDRFIPARYRKAHAAHVRHFGETGVTSRTMGHLGTLYGVRADGTEFPIEATIAQANTDNERLYTVVLRDITDRVRSEVTLRASEERFRAVFEQAAVGIEQVAMDGKLLDVNDKVCEILGASRADVVGRTVMEITHPDDRGREGAMLSRLIAGEVAHYTLEKRYLRKDGRPVWVRLTSSLAHAANGESYRISVVEDITDRKRAEEAQQRWAEELAQANRAKDEFLAMLGHELRNPLGAIANALELLRLHAGRPADDPANRRTREVLERQTRHLTRLVDDILDVSRITRGKIELRRERLDLRTVVTHAAESARVTTDRGEHPLSIRVPSDPVPVDADPARLEQVLQNLLNNAAKYSGPGAQIEVALERQGEQAVLRVCDTGIGIPPELLPHVFDPFTQAHHTLDRAEGGLGIGLTLVKRLVELHGGTVDAYSLGEGQGSTFTVRLPLAGSPAPQAAPEPSESDFAETSGRIVVVEDNPDAAQTLSEILKAWGFHVQTAYDGLTALQTVREHRPKVVLLDIGLPGMDGYEVAATLRRQNGPNSIRIVALTGYGQEEDRRRAREAGFDDLLVKPVDLDALRSVLRRDVHGGE